MIDLVQEIPATRASGLTVKRTPGANMRIRLATIFQLSLYGMAALSGGVLSWAEGRPLPTGLTVPFAIIALFVNERIGLIRISGFFANILGLLAFVLPTFEFFGDNPEGRLLAGAHLLVYLQWILLFQEKSRQQYWWVCTLSVLQVAVAAVLTNSGWFGFWLGTYLFLSIWTLSVFSLFQMEQEFTTRTSEFARAKAAGSRRSSILDAIQHDPLDSWITFRFVGGVFLMSFVALLVGLMFFLFIPRVNFGRFTGIANLAPAGGISQTGFSDQVRLGDMGEILESTDVAFRLRIVDILTGRSLDVQEYAARLGYDEPLFRGGVMTSYDNGRWSPSRSEYQKLLPDSIPLQNAVSQEYELNPLGTNVLFAMRPIHGGNLIDDRGEIGIHSETSSLMRYGRAQSRITNYRVLSFRPRKGEQLRDEVRPLPLLRGFTRRHCLALPSGTVRLQQLSQDIVAEVESNLAGRTVSDMDRARALESYFLTSGGFTYTLSAEIKDPLIDPVEDFLFNRRSGHCEYYATALALMLRSVGIPARLVTGFKGGIVNPISKQFEVQQRHAHAWVEAYIEDDWVALDATPSEERLAAIEEAGAARSLWVSFAGFATRVWQDYVLNLSPARQQQELYGPMRRTAVGIWQLFTRPDSSMSNIGEIVRNFLASPRRWFSWQGGVIAFFLMLSLVGLGAVIRRFVLWLRGQRHSGKNHVAGPYQRVDFYEEFLKIVGRHGFHPDACQTPSEFADSVRDGIATRAGANGLALFPAELTEAFYRVRFGAIDVPRDERTELDSALARFAEALATDSKGTSVNSGTAPV